MQRIPIWKRRKAPSGFWLVLVFVVVFVSAYIAWHWWATLSMPDKIVSYLPDAVPMVVAIVGIIMSYKQPERRNHLRTTLVLVSTGILGTVVIAWARHRVEEKQNQAESQKVSQMEQAFSADLKEQLIKQKDDLMKAFRAEAKTPAEQAFLDRVAPIAKMDFGFANDSTGGYDNVLNVPVSGMVLGGPPRHVGNIRGLPFPSRLASFKLAGRVTSKPSAKNAHIWIRICDGCDWSKISEGFRAPQYGPNALTEVDKQIGDIPAGAVLPIGDFEIALPLHPTENITIGVGYTCDNCAPVDPKQMKKLKIHAPLK